VPLPDGRHPQRHLPHARWKRRARYRTKVSAPCCASFEVPGGRIVSPQIYFGRMLLAGQLGLIPLVNA
jgi:hypothetical protein